MSRAALEKRLDAAMTEYQAAPYRSSRYWALVDEIYTLQRQVQAMEDEAVEAAQTVRG
jgi:hypothetical protein